jgi:hypothetical protein
MPDKPPASKNQLLRIQELLENPALDDYIGELGEAKFKSMISTRGGAGILLMWMKKKIAEQEQKNDT